MPVYEKLVRDGIPKIIGETGKDYEIKTLTDSEYINALKLKLMEEVNEYYEAEDNKGAVEELADILELMKALANQHHSSLEEVEIIRKEKVNKRGSFNEKIYLIEVED